MKRDPIEDDPKFRPIIDAVNERVEQELVELGIKDQWGSCYTKWDIKKRILHHEYGIEWQSPKDLNPRIVFD